MQIPELIDTFQSWNSRHRAPATVAFYRARLKKFRDAYNARDFSSLTALEIDVHLATAGIGMSDSTRHHDAVALERLQKFAIQHRLLEKPVFGILEKPRVGRRDRIPTPAETATLLAQASPEFRLIYSALRQCGALPAVWLTNKFASANRAAIAIFRSANWKSQARTRQSDALGHARQGQVLLHLFPAGVNFCCCVGRRRLLLLRGRSKCKPDHPCQDGDQGWIDEKAVGDYC